MKFQQEIKHFYSNVLQHVDVFFFFFLEHKPTANIALKYKQGVTSLYGLGKFLG